ncbi:hypothetical protein BZG36_03187 [Bifiguratus adelaidae]|uniref:AMP-activated protein kinase glycogen-binding domain-containing protein n=1 Tax=Bifiguratus adelaidae TaxID=1938954 RepID=A0A261XYL6_9FUNG|nr:hypothetical protein BZG36_03187 [Bifiguratus adelaidae]
MATFEYTFVWPSAAHNTVVVTGSFDNWSQSTPLQKDEAQNRFAATVAVPRGSERIFYKFVVDGTWTTSEVEGAQVTRDEEGNANNYIDPTPIEEEEKPLHDSAAGQTATVETAANVAAIDEMAKDQDTAVSKDVPNGTVEASTPITEVDSVPQPVLPADVVPTDNAQVKEDQEDPALFAASSNDVNEDPAFGAETEPIVIGEPTEDSQVVVTPPQPKADDLEHAVIAEPPVAAPPLSIEESVEELESGKAAPDIEAINRALTPPTSPQSVVSPLKAEAVAAEPNGLPQEEFGLGKEAVPVEADTTTQAEPVTPAAEPITEESVTPTAEPVAEEPAAPTAEPVAEESVAPIAEPVAEEPAAPIAEPVAEEPVAPIAEPVAEESVAPTAEPVTEVPSLKDVAPEVVTVGAGLVPQQAVIDTATAAPRTQPELEVEEPVVPETESSADATVPLTSQIEQIEADKVEDAAISAAVAADEVAAPVPKEEGLFERAKEAAAEPEPESADIPADASVPESLAVGQSRDTATDIKDAEFEAPKEEATPAETTAEPAQASLETGQPQPEKAIVDTAEEPTQAPELPKQDAPVPQETPVVDAPAADTKGETDAPAEVQAQPTEQAAVSQPASQQEQSEPAQTKEKEQKKGKFLKRIKSLFKGDFGSPLRAAFSKFGDFHFTKELPNSVLKERAEDIVDTLCTAYDSSTRESAKAELFNLGARVPEWLTFIFEGVLNPQCNEECRAASFKMLKALYAEPPMDADSAKAIQNALSKNATHMFQRLLHLLEKRQEIHVLKVWTILVDLLGDTIHKGKAMQMPLKIIEACFNTRNPSVQKQAFEAWIHLILNFEINAFILHPKRLVLIQTPIENCLRNTKHTSVKSSALKAWITLLSVCGEQGRQQHFDLVVARPARLILQDLDPFISRAGLCVIATLLGATGEVISLEENERINREFANLLTVLSPFEPVWIRKHVSGALELFWVAFNGEIENLLRNSDNDDPSYYVKLDAPKRYLMRKSFAKIWRGLLDALQKAKATEVIPSSASILSLHQCLHLIEKIMTFEDVRLAKTEHRHTALIIAKYLVDALTAAFGARIMVSSKFEIMFAEEDGSPFETYKSKVTPLEFLIHQWLRRASGSSQDQQDVFIAAFDEWLEIAGGAMRVYASALRFIVTKGADQVSDDDYEFKIKHWSVLASSLQRYMNRSNSLTDILYPGQDRCHPVVNDILLYPLSHCIASGKDLNHIMSALWADVIESFCRVAQTKLSDADITLSLLATKLLNEFAKMDSEELCNVRRIDLVVNAAVPMLRTIEIGSTFEHESIVSLNSFMMGKALSSASRMTKASPSPAGPLLDLTAALLRTCYMCLQSTGGKEAMSLDTIIDFLVALTQFLEKLPRSLVVPVLRLLTDSLIWWLTDETGHIHKQTSKNRKALERELHNMHIQILKGVKAVTPHDSKLLNIISTYLCAAFMSPCRSIFESTVAFWNETFGKRLHPQHYPDTIKDLLGVVGTKVHIEIANAPETRKRKREWNEVSEKENVPTPNRKPEGSIHRSKRTPPPSDASKLFANFQNELRLKQAEMQARSPIAIKRFTEEKSKSFQEYNAQPAHIFQKSKSQTPTYRKPQMSTLYENDEEQDSVDRSKERHSRTPTPVKRRSRSPVSEDDEYEPVVHERYRPFTRVARVQERAQLFESLQKGRPSTPSEVNYTPGRTNGEANQNATAPPTIYVKSKLFDTNDSSRISTRSMATIGAEITAQDPPTFASDDSSDPETPEEATTDALAKSDPSLFQDEAMKKALMTIKRYVDTVNSQMDEEEYAEDRQH